MKKENFDKIKPDRSLITKKGVYFIGKTVLRDISKTIGISDQKVYYAAFKSGGRTKLHYHEGGQTLVVTHGAGILVLYKKLGKRGSHLRMRQAAKSMLRKGDIVHIPRGTLHWHGAAKGKDLAHIAINGFSKGREAKTIWFDSNFRSFAVRIR